MAMSMAVLKKCFWFCVALALSAWPAGAQPIDVWLDVDPASGIGEVDDGLAMIQAFHSPELHVRGMSVVFGNSPLKYGHPLAVNLTRSFGPAQLQIYPGAASAEELGQTNPAVEAMAQALTERPMTILALGPATNVGSLLKLHPRLHGRIDRIVLVAGRRPGQRFAYREDQELGFRDFNFELDPQAVRVILQSRIPLVLAPWEVSSKVWLTEQDLAQLRDTGDTGRFIYQTTHHWFDRWEQGVGRRAFNPFDSLAVGFVTHPQLIDAIPVHAWIEDLPDDGSKSTQAIKPYLLVRPIEADVQTQSSQQQAHEHKILFCTTASGAFHRLLMQRLGRPDTPTQGTIHAE